MREYKRNYRAKKKAARLPAADWFLSMSCLSLSEAEKIGHGACSGWAVTSRALTLTGDDIGAFFDFLSKIDKKSNIYLCNLKVWGRFIIAEAKVRAFRASETCDKAQTFRVLVDNYGSWLSIQINVAGQKVFIKDFSGIIKTGIRDAALSFCDYELKEDASNVDIANAMKLVFERFNDEIEAIFGVKIKASTIASYAKRALYSLYGQGCLSYGEARFKSDFPELPREIMDDIRNAKCYRSGLNYMPESSRGYSGAGYMYDRRSFYPWIYSNFAMPYGQAFKRDYEDVIKKRKAMQDNVLGDCFDDFYYCIYNIFELSATLKPAGVPCIQIINKTGTQYLKNIDFADPVCFMLDTYDLKALYENYDVELITIDYVYIFKRKIIEPLRDFGKRLYKIKEEKKGEARSVVAKYLINSITGQFGANSYRRETVIENGQYKRSELKYCGETGYLPVAMCINSIGRWLMARDIRHAGLDNYLYGDTDSIITREPAHLAAAGREMGQYDGRTFTDSVFLMQKCYGLNLTGSGWRWVVSGANPEMLQDLSKNEFYAGAKLKGGCVPHVYPDLTFAFEEREFTLASQMIMF